MSTSNEDQLVQEILLEIYKRLPDAQACSDAGIQTRLRSQTQDLIALARSAASCHARQNDIAEGECTEDNTEQPAQSAHGQTDQGDQAVTEARAGIQAEPGVADSSEHRQEQIRPSTVANASEEPAESLIPDRAAHPDNHQLKQAASSTPQDSGEHPPELSEPTIAPSDRNAAPERSATIDPHRKPGAIPTASLPSAEPALPRLIVTIAANANAGKPYQAAIEARTDSGHPVRILHCDIPTQSGVRYEDGALVGSTPEAGEYRIQVTGACEDIEYPLTASADLIVNHDPKTLWKDIPSDPCAPGWKLDERAFATSGAGGRRLIGASIRGRSHAHTGGFREDDFLLQASTDGRWNIIAVADGAGSASRSRIGSRIATEVAVQQAQAQLLSLGPAAIDEWRVSGDKEPTRALRVMFYQALGTAALEALKAIEEQARYHDADIREYATTLLLATHTHTEIGDLVGTFWVGDGAIALCDQAGGARLLGQPDSGAFSGQTRFLDRSAVDSGQEIMSRIHCAITPALDSLLLMTDGVSDPLFESDNELHSPARWRELQDQLMPLIQTDTATEKLVSWLKFWRKGHHDDRTIVVLY